MFILELGTIPPCHVVGHASPTCLQTSVRTEIPRNIHDADENCFRSADQRHGFATVVGVPTSSPGAPETLGCCQSNS